MFETFAKIEIVLTEAALIGGVLFMGIMIIYVFQ
jgi:hypothetical protein